MPNTQFQITIDGLLVVLSSKNYKKKAACLAHNPTKTVFFQGHQQASVFSENALYVLPMSAHRILRRHTQGSTDYEINNYGFITKVILK